MNNINFFILVTWEDGEGGGEGEENVLPQNVLPQAALKESSLSASSKVITTHLRR